MSLSYSESGLQVADKCLYSLNRRFRGTRDAEQVVVDGGYLWPIKKCVNSVRVKGAG
jgi:hypothetical protein